MKRAWTTIAWMALAAAGGLDAAPPDLTSGGVPDSERTQNLGATGMRGWVYAVANSDAPTAESRQILVTEIDVGSPADGIVWTNDVVIGADGTGAVPTLFTNDARRSLGLAIGDAEARIPADLDLLVWRAGVTNVLQITLETMGTYSATAPYSCPKSEKILEQGLDTFYANEDSGRESFGLLTLLASTNTDHLARARTEARALIPTAGEMTNMLAGVRPDGGKDGWNRAYALLTQAEYYLATGDTNVLPAIEARAVEISRNQSMFGTIGHKFADKNADGSDNGSMSGYGPINTPGSVGFLALLLARKCGVTNAYVQQGIHRADRFFAHYARGSAIPYGEHESARPKTYRASNGKNAVVALAFSLQTNRVTECRYFSRMCTAASMGRESGHTGPFFEYVWAPLGAAVAGQEAAVSHFRRISWHLDLQRRWDGAFAYDNLASDGDKGNGKRYGGFSTTAGILLTYALPRRTLHITGTHETIDQVLDAADVADAERSAAYDPTVLPVATLIADLGNSLPQTSRAAATELGTRTDATNHVNQLIAMAQNTSTNVELRVGACDALRYIDDSRGLSVLAGLLSDGENCVRRTAAESLRYMTGRETQRDTILAAVAAVGRPLQPFDEEDPIHFDEMKLSQLLFYGGSAYGARGLLHNDISGVDTNLLYPAIEVCAATPSGFGRNCVKTSYTLFSLADLHALAGTVVDSVKVVAPADRMFSHGIRINGIQLLERYGIAEGIPLCPIFIDDNPSASFARSSLQALEDYAGACLKVAPDADIVGYLEGEIGGPPPHPVGTYATEAAMALSAITNDLNPYVPTPFKRITSISAGSNPITLTGATVATTLQVEAFDYAEGDAIFTWRKIHGASPLDLTPNATAGSTNASVVFNTPGLHRFEVTMSDSRGLTQVSSQLVVTVYNSSGSLPPNDPPTADAQSLGAIQDTDLPVTLTGSDPEGYPLVFAIDTPPQHGTILGTGSNVIYRPDPYYRGSDSFSFDVQDSDGQTDTATVTITVDAVSYGGLSGELGLLDLANANGGINPVTGAPWARGDQYRLAFVTYAGTDATATNISTYNAFVQGVASDAGLGGSWKVLGSTAAVDARDNTSSNPAEDGDGVAIFLLDGTTKVADGNTDLWDTSLDAPINMDELRTGGTDVTVFTGSDTDGTGRGSGDPDERVLGGSNDETPPKVTTGNSGAIDSKWMAQYNTAATTIRQVLALSDPLQILNSGSLASEPVTLFLFR